MRTFDYTPLYRNTVGFDRLFNLLSNAERTSSGSSWPPYDIETTGENAYRITLAVAGFSADDLEITLEDNVLRIATSNIADETHEDDHSRFLYRGIAQRAFSLRFNLA